VRSGPGEARTILLLHIISVRPSKQPLMVRTFLKVYMELGSYFLFLQEQIKDIIIFPMARKSRTGSVTSCSAFQCWTTGYNLHGRMSPKQLTRLSTKSVFLGLKVTVRVEEDGLLLECQRILGNCILSLTV